MTEIIDKNELFKVALQDLNSYKSEQEVLFTSVCLIISKIFCENIKSKEFQITPEYLNQKNGSVCITTKISLKIILSDGTEICKDYVESINKDIIVKNLCEEILDYLINRDNPVAKLIKGLDMRKIVNDSSFAPNIKHPIISTNIK